MKTICAIATGLVNCAIHIIRVSGDDCYDIVQKICERPIAKKGFVIQRNLIIDSDQKPIDDVLLNTFIAPKSYTGEDLIEINCHGGIIVAKQIINLLIKHGCEMAKNGEFSQRALLNKKMNYQQIESINSLIHADNEIATSFAINGALGKDSDEILKLREKIFSIIGSIEVNIDYPEYDDIPQMSATTIEETLLEVKTSLHSIINNTYHLQPLIKGIKIAIIGSPNVGKSSLLNLLSQQEKAIVSNIQGTTRDVIESEITFNGIKIVLIDTAGIRVTDDEIEKLGIQKSYDAINRADLIIHLKDSLQDTFNISDLIDKEKIIEVYNKADIESFPGKINISVKDKNIDPLLKLIEDKINHIDYHKINTIILQSERQIQLMNKIVYHIDLILNELANDVPLDLIIQKLEIILLAFDEFLGKTLPYDKLDEMFSKFCLGK